MKTTGCELCGKKINQKQIGTQVYECGYCGAIYGTCYLGQSCGYVKPYFDNSDYDAQELGTARYFDLTCLGSKGITRRHGWFNPENKMITQEG